METIHLNSLNNVEVKAKLLSMIMAIIEKNPWNQTDAAKVLSIDQPKISQIKNGKIAGFSLERLLIFLNRLNCKIAITITEESKEIPVPEKAEHEYEL